MAPGTRAEGSGRPGPEGDGPAEFVLAMLRLKSWADVSFRELERRAAAVGDSLPRSTISNALDRGRLPAAHLVEAFARACGCDEDEVALWVRARRRVAADSVGDPDQPETLDPPVSDLPTSAPPTSAPPAPGSPAPGSPESGPFAHDPPASGPAVPGSPGPLGSLKGRSLRLVGRSRQRLWLLLAVLVLVAAGSTPAALSSYQARRMPEPLAVPPPSDSDLVNPPEPPSQARPVLYVGDSIAAETASAVRYFVHSSGKGAVAVAARPRAALCDFLDDDRSSLNPRNRLAALVGSVKPAVVVLQFWGYSSIDTPCTGGAKPGTTPYFDHYAAAAGQAMREIERAYETYKSDGTRPPRVLWVLQGPDKADAERTRRLNEEIYRQAGDVVDAGAQVSMAAFLYEVVHDGRYQWTQYLPCSDEERAYGLCTHPRAFGGVTAVHPDNEDHLFCLNAASPERCLVRSPGLIRYGRAIAEGIVAAL